MLGIDLVLGQRIDQLVNNKNLMFLPEYLEAILDSTKITTVDQSKTLISDKKVLIPSNEDKSSRRFKHSHIWLDHPHDYVTSSLFEK